MTAPRRRLLAKSNRTVWVVLHCEYMRNPKHQFIDEMLFYVASSLAAAERFIRRSMVDRHSWWEVQRRFLDVEDDDKMPEKHFYSHTGKPRKSPPHKQAMRAYVKHWASLPTKITRYDPD
jgi:hypothetical protein